MSESSPRDAVFPDFLPRRLGASGVADSRIWSYDFRERLEEERPSRHQRRRARRRRQKAADEFDTLSTAVQRLYQTD